MSRLLTPVRQAVRLLALLLPAVLIAGLLATDYNAGATFVIGLLVGCICLIVSAFWGQAIVNVIGRFFTAIFARPLVILSIIILLFLVGLLSQLLTIHLGLPPSALSEVNIGSYKALLAPRDMNSGTFDVHEEISVENTLIELPARRVFAANRGFALSEVSFDPLTDTFVITVTASSIHLPSIRYYYVGLQLVLDTSEYVSLSIADKRVALLQRGGQSVDFGYLKPQQATIEINDIPKGSFYQSNVPSSNPHEYVNVESVALHPDDFDRVVKFAYVPPPYNAIKSLITPFLGAASLGQFFIAVLGVAVAGFALYVSPVLSDMVRGRIRSLVTGRHNGDAGQESNGETVTLLGPHGETLRQVKKRDRPK
jgi:hypothetical protein